MAHLKINKRIPIDFLMGHDAELAITDKNENLIYAEDCDPDKCEEFGSDGGGALHEIRVNPSYSPLELVSDTRRIFKKQLLENKYYQNYNWYAGSFYLDLGIGGHIHIDLKKNQINPLEASTILSNYLASICLLIEDYDEAVNRRENGGYGFYNDFRTDVSYKGFEYRSLSSWLTSPYISAAVLCLAKVLMWEAVNNKKFHGTHYVDKSHFQSMQTQDIRLKFPKIWRDILKMQLYPKYKNHIDLLYKLVINKKNWFPKYDLKTAWGLDIKKNNDNPIKKLKYVKFEEIWSKSKFKKDTTYIYNNPSYNPSYNFDWITRSKQEIA